MSCRTPTLDEELDAFLADLRLLAPVFRWVLVLPNGKLRCRVAGHACCPLEAVAWYKSGDSWQERTLPPSYHLPAAAGVSDRLAACVIHLADNIKSRYYDDERRALLLAAARGQKAATTDPN